MSPFWQTVLRLAEEEREQTGQAVSEQLRDVIICILALVLAAMEVAAVLGMAP